MLGFLCPKDSQKQLKEITSAPQRQGVIARKLNFNVSSKGVVCCVLTSSMVLLCSSSTIESSLTSVTDKPLRVWRRLVSHFNLSDINAKIYNQDIPVLQMNECLVLSCTNNNPSISFTHPSTFLPNHSPVHAPYVISSTYELTFSDISVLFLDFCLSSKRSSLISST